MHIITGNWYQTHSEPIFKLLNIYFLNISDLYTVWSPKCAANTEVGVDMSPHCFIKCPNGLASYTASGSKV